MEQHKKTRTLGSLEAALGVSFGDRELLRLALVHSSYLNENHDAFSEPNERLEFLGDALIGAVVANELYCRYSEWSEGRLTQARSALVRGDTLARVGKKLGLGHHLYMGRGEQAAGGRERPTNLADALEAVVGALFLDQGYEAARDWFLGVSAAELSTLEEGRLGTDPKSSLQELTQGKGQGVPSYRITEAAGEAHARQFTAEVSVDGRIVGQGAGARKHQAEQAAAAAALQKLAETPQTALSE